MNTSVGLQDAFSYAKWPMIALASVLVLFGIYLLLVFILKKINMKEKPKPVVVKEPPKDIEMLKRKYLKDLYDLSVEFSSDRVNLRKAYQRMSAIIRNFVFEATGVKVQNYTLDDIRNAGLPRLEALVAEYYSPEFARMSEGDFSDSMMRTKKVIEQWM